MKRVCTKCGEPKENECFSSSDKNRAGLNSVCRVCDSEINKTRYDNKKVNDLVELFHDRRGQLICPGDTITQDYLQTYKMVCINNRLCFPNEEVVKDYHGLNRFWEVVR